MSENYFKNTNLTLTTAFLLPGIGHRRSELLSYGFINGYLDDPAHDIRYRDSVYLLFKPKNMEVIRRYLEQEEKNPLYLVDYDYIGGYVVVVYKFNERFLREYRLFKQGRYSKFSKEYVALFPQYVEVKNSKTGQTETTFSLPYHVFNKTKALKEWREEAMDIKFEDYGITEYWSKPDEEKETLIISRIIKEEDAKKDKEGEAKKEEASKGKVNKKEEKDEL